MRRRPTPAAGPAPTVEQGTDALVDGDVPYAPGTARAALAHRDFRIVWTGALLSNIGSWMQNVVLGAFAYQLTGSSTFVGLIVFAQLAPLLFLSLLGGLLADVVDRRRLLMYVAVEQMICSIALAGMTGADDPSRVGILAAVALIGVGQAVHAPTFTAVLPSLVGSRDLAGAISLNSVQINIARVVGPAIGGVAYAAFGASTVFLVNAATYPLVIIALAMVRFPPVVDQGGDRGWRRLLTGFRVARDVPMVRRCLLTMAVFAFFCLPFITQMPALASDNLGLSTRTVGYGLLYACFGLGAVAGAMSISTILAGRSKARIVRAGMAVFAVSLAVWALLRVPEPAYPLALVVGYSYFAAITALATLFQEHLEDGVRGRATALWIMAFGGTVPFGNAIAGPIIDATSVSTVILAGAGVAGLLAWRTNLDEPSPGRIEEGGGQALEPGDPASLHQHGVARA